MLKEYMVLVMPPGIEGMCRLTQPADDNHSLVLSSLATCNRSYSGASVPTEP
jgi:hypothetical protein